MINHISYRFFLILLLPLILQSCFNEDLIDVSNHFVKFYMEGEAVDMVKAVDGGTVLLGNNGVNSWLFKVDDQGNLEWGGTNPISDFVGKDILVNSSFTGDYILVGNDNNGLTKVLFYFSKGNRQNDLTVDLSEIRSKRCDAELFANQLEADQDGGLLIIGYSKDCKGLQKPFLAKIGNDRILQWTSELGLADSSSNVVMSKSMVGNGNGDFIYASLVSDPTGATPAFVRIAKFNSLTRQETPLPAITNLGDKITISELIPYPNGYTVIGTKEQLNKKNILFFRLDQDGQFIFNSERTIISSESDDNIVGNSLFKTVDGGFILLGSISQGFTSKNNFYLIKTDETGNRNWEQIIGGEEVDESGRVVQQIPEGNFMIFGTWRLGTLMRMTLIKTTADGDLVD